MRSVIFIAPPAGGKGTISDLVCSKFNMPHISTGDLLRNKVNANDEMGEYIKEQMKSGALIKDEIIFDLIKDRINNADCNSGYVLDGFPRNIEQAKVYDEILASLNKELGCVILLDTPKELAEKRIAGRLSCSKCGRVYNSLFEEMKPKNDSLCDDCNFPLTKREDDNAETYAIRYQTYIKETQPLINYYDKKGVLYTVDGTLTKEEILDEVEKIIRGE